MRPRGSSASDTVRVLALNRALRRRPSGGTQPGADMLSIAEQGAWAHTSLLTCYAQHVRYRIQAYAGCAAACSSA